VAGGKKIECPAKRTGLAGKDKYRKGFQKLWVSPQYSNSRRGGSPHKRSPPSLKEMRADEGKKNPKQKCRKGGGVFYGGRRSCQTERASRALNTMMIKTTAAVSRSAFEAGHNRGRSKRQHRDPKGIVLKK